MTIDESNLQIIDRDLEHSTFSIKSGTSSNLRKIKVLGTGGTIASKGSTSSHTAGYRVDLTIEELLSSIPDISSRVNVEYEQVMNLDSKDMDSSHLLILYHALVETLKQESFDGIVITHGTDTMEESAFFLQFCINTEIPIVLSGSMRPSTSISADGPMNLYQAICIASDKRSRGRGILVSLNDQISSGFFITKANANTLDTFNGKQGYLGNFVNNEIHYYYPPAKPIGLSEFFELKTEKALEQVVVLYLHQGFDEKLFRIILSNMPQVKGFVIATMGAGSLSIGTQEELSAIWQEYKIPIILSKRTIEGMVPRANIRAEGCISGGYLNPQKARILLQLCLNKGMDVPEIESFFAKSYGVS